MIKYYTRACNFFYGQDSRQLVKKKLTLPLCNDSLISFNRIELFSRNKKIVKNKIVDLKNIKKLPKKIKEKVIQDLKKITSKREFLGKKSHVIMGIINITPDSFSDGGKYNTFKKAYQRIKKLIKSGADIIDIGGESTRPGSKVINPKNELERVKKVIKKFKKSFLKTLLSIDTRKSQVIDYALKIKVDIVNDVSCFKYDQNSHKSLRNKNIWKIIHHMQGTPQTMQINPKYHHVLLDIYDFFEKSIKHLHNKKIVIDPGIGFGKNLKHNLTLISKISLFHSLGFPILIGTSRKRFISQISGAYDSKERIGGTVASVLFLLSQGVQIFRVHNVNEVKQSILVFRKILSNTEN